jgi:hypothetical protein
MVAGLLGILATRAGFALAVRHGEWPISRWLAFKASLAGARLDLSPRLLLLEFKRLVLI